MVGGAVTASVVIPRSAPTDRPAIDTDTREREGSSKQTKPQDPEASTPAGSTTKLDGVGEDSPADPRAGRAAISVTEGAFSEFNDEEEAELEAEEAEREAEEEEAERKAEEKEEREEARQDRRDERDDN